MPGNTPIPFARTMRRRQTRAESLLWRHLRGREFGGYAFRRQHPLGAYVVEFSSARGKLIVETDGGERLANARADRTRAQWLKDQGYRMLLFRDDEVLADPQAVLAAIHRALAGPLP